MQDRFSDSITHLPFQLADAIMPMLDQNFCGHLSQAQVTQLQESTGLNEKTLLLALLPIAATLANPPISEFYVGAIVKGNSGDIYMGANIEFTSEALYNSIHAEQHAISHAWLSGETGITDIVVNFSPCGHCRQFINELPEASDIQIHLPEQPTHPLSHYLPYAFGPKDLDVDQPLLTNQKVELRLNTNAPLISQALAEASQSYAPYSQCYAAIVIETKNGQTFVGRYAENAAFNPSMLPMQMAWANMLRNNAKASDINRVVLVESENAKISLTNASKMALAAISNIKLEYVKAQFIS